MESLVSKHGHLEKPTLDFLGIIRVGDFEFPIGLRDQLGILHRFECERVRQNKVTEGLHNGKPIRDCYSQPGGAESLRGLA